MKKTTTRKSDFIITLVFAFGIYALLDNQLFGINYFVQKFNFGGFEGGRYLTSSQPTFLMILGLLVVYCYYRRKTLFNQRKDYSHSEKLTFFEKSERYSSDIFTLSVYAASYICILLSIVLMISTVAEFKLAYGHFKLGLAFLLGFKSAFTWLLPACMLIFFGIYILFVCSHIISIVCNKRANKSQDAL